MGNKTEIKQFLFISVLFPIYEPLNYEDRWRSHSLKLMLWTDVRKVKSSRRDRCVGGSDTQAITTNSPAPIRIKSLFLVI